MLKNNKRDTELQTYADAFVKLNPEAELDITFLIPHATANAITEELNQISLAGSYSFAAPKAIAQEENYKDYVLFTFTLKAHSVDLEFVVATIAECAPHSVVTFSEHGGSKSVTVL